MYSTPEIQRFPLSFLSYWAHVYRTGRQEDHRGTKTQRWNSSNINFWTPADNSTRLHLLPTSDDNRSELFRSPVRAFVPRWLHSLSWSNLSASFILNSPQQRCHRWRKRSEWRLKLQQLPNAKCLKEKNEKRVGIQHRNWSFSHPHVFFFSFDQPSLRSNLTWQYCHSLSASICHSCQSSFFSFFSKFLFFSVFLHGRRYEQMAEETEQ